MSEPITEPAGEPVEQKIGFKKLIINDFFSAYDEDGLSAAFDIVAPFTVENSPIRLTEQELLLKLTERVLGANNADTALSFAAKVREVRPDYYQDVENRIRKDDILSLPDISGDSVSASEVDNYVRKVCMLAKYLPALQLIGIEDYQIANAWLQVHADYKNDRLRAGLILNVLSSDNFRESVSVDDMKFAFVEGDYYEVLRLVKSDFANSAVGSKAIAQILETSDSFVGLALKNDLFLESIDPDKAFKYINGKYWADTFALLAKIAKHEKMNDVVKRLTGQRRYREGGVFYAAFKSLEGAKPYVGMIVEPTKISLYVDEISSNTTERGFKSLFKFKEPERSLVLQAIDELTREIANNKQIEPALALQAGQFLQKMALEFQSRGMQLMITHQEAQRPAEAEAAPASPPLPAP